MRVALIDCTAVGASATLRWLRATGVRRVVGTDPAGSAARGCMRGKNEYSLK